MPRVRPEIRRASASSWRTVPTRHGVHCPHDSSRKKPAIRIRIVPMSTVSSKTTIAPEPSVALAARASSKVSGRSSSSGPTNTPAAPPSSTACSCLPPGTPPARASSAPSVSPNGTS